MDRAIPGEENSPPLHLFLFWTYPHNKRTLPSPPKKRHQKKKHPIALANQNPSSPLLPGLGESNAAPSIIPTPTPTAIHTDEQQYATDHQHRHQHQHHIDFQIHPPEPNHPLQPRFTTELDIFLRSSADNEGGGGGGSSGGPSG